MEGGAIVNAEAKKQETAHTSLMRKNERDKTWFLIWFIGPALLVYAMYVVYPIFATFYYSLFEWSGVQSDKGFILFENYRVLLEDKVFLRSMVNNFLLVIASVGTQLPLGLIMALILFAPIKGMRLYRTVYFLPLLMSTVAVGILWTFIYDPSFGILNHLLDVIGLGHLQHGWLGETDTAFLAVIAVITWQFSPFYMILMRAAMVGIPEEIYESAQIDGCGGWQKFWRITLPLLKPTLITSAVLSVIGSLKYFDLIYVMTEGGPSNRTELMATYMYKQAFNNFNMGYASTLSFAMFVLAFIVAILILAADKNRRKVAE
jgi:raffinose/stachyose/melibiose transport system permease protein